MDRICPVCKNKVLPTDAACPFCGFKLLGGTEEFEPISLDEKGREQRPAKKAHSATLTVVRGPQIGTVYVLDDKIQTIGRDPKSEIFLNDMTVSREHATVTPQGEGFVIRDLASYNGIWINNKNIDQALLVDDDIIQVGTFCLLYED